ncbi:hypothetical protein ACMD2_05552 [Ananas comosus]|uniref:DUF761 domain-containing protein n=1 Tax=Ananas comosus TaxID=4615 RepID=A0A199VHR7_ANACO|nr:hypothetical protein ACMD2_05552 [Ananas comosus]
MELHSPTAAKKLWSYLRAVFFMMRKGLVSNKRKLLIDMNLFMKRGNKILGRSLTNLIFHHHHHHHHHHPHSQRSQSIAATTMTIMREYEFSCSNSPNPVFFRGRRHAYFPCLNAVVEDEEDKHSWPCAPAAQKRIEYSPQSSSSSTTATTSLLAEELFAPGERRSPSPTSVRISEYYSDDDDKEEEEEEEEVEDGDNGEVDDEAEEFIRRFYEQLRAQRRIALFEYQEEYQHMLARGT